MKSRNDKPKKKLETNIGKIIYGFLLFMPLIAIAVTCAYVIFNKNAYQSYYGENINQYKNVHLQNNTELIDNDNELYMENNYFLNTTLSGTLTYQEVSLVSGNFTNPSAENMEIIANSNRIYFYRGTSVTFYDDTNQTSFIMSGISGLMLKFINIQSTPNSNIAPAFYYIDYIDTTYLSNAFYYAIEEVEQNALFNWSKNSLIYTGMNSTANALSINITFIPMLLTYWLIISVFYYLYDIILIILNVFHRKIHELEESI